MRSDVPNRNIADRKQIAQTNDGCCDACGRTKSRIPPTGDQLVMFEAYTKDRCEDRIHRYDPGKCQGKLAELCCHVSYSFVKSERPPLFPFRIWKRTWRAWCPRQIPRRGPSCRWPWRLRGQSKCLEEDLCRRT